MTAPVAQSSKPERRSVLNWFLGAGILGWAASVLYPVLRYLRPLCGRRGRRSPEAERR